MLESEITIEKNRRRQLTRMANTMFEYAGVREKPLDLYARMVVDLATLESNWGVDPDVAWNHTLEELGFNAGDRLLFASIWMELAGRITNEGVDLKSGMKQFRARRGGY